MCTLTSEPIYPLSGIPVEGNETNAAHLLSDRTNSSRTDGSFSTLHSKVVDSYSYYDCQREEKPLRTSPKRDARCFSSFSSKFRKKYRISKLIHHESFAQKKGKFSISEKDWSDDSSTYEKATQIQLVQGFENLISALCTSDGSGNYEDVNWEMNTMWETLHNKPELKYSSAKQKILQQLLKILSSSKRESELRVSVSILMGLISVDRTILDNIKRENFHLYNLATALKRNVHEAATLIYLLNPSPSEIRSLQLLPDLVEVACNSNREKEGMRSLLITPASASIAMIEILVTAFDYVTNNMHLAAISSPQLLTKLVNVAMNTNISEGVTLATILMRCMRLNGNCRKFLSQLTQIDPFIHLLESNKMSAKSAALEYFHELLWGRRAAKVIIKGGISVFGALAKGIQSQRQSVQRDCLITAAWLGSEMTVIPSGSLRYSACEILLDEVAAFLHPGTQLDERVLACLSVYNYTSKKEDEERNDRFGRAMFGKKLQSIKRVTRVSAAGVKKRREVWMP